MAVTRLASCSRGSKTWPGTGQGNGIETMSDLVTRVLRDEEIRAANALFRGALHTAAPSDEEWAQERWAFQSERTYGVFDQELIGTTRSIDADLIVPGGGTVPLGAVTGVGVRADHTRRGVLTELMQTQLTGFAERGVVAASLYATEGGIYGRFGYGVATMTRSYTVNRRLAQLRVDVPAGGEVELLDVDTALRRLPDIYAGFPRRPGMMSRPSYWWNRLPTRLRRTSEPVVTVVHHGPGGADGFVQYRVEKESGRTGTLRVLDLHTANGEAFVGLWRFLLGVDLVDTIEASARPLDEPVELLFTDPRICTVTGTSDEVWLRLVDVPTALAARRYAGEPVVLDVVDPLVKSNCGRYRVGPGEVRPTREPAELRLDVDALAMVYLGTWRPSALAQVGRAYITSSEVAARADALFRTRSHAWCGTFF